MICPPYPINEKDRQRAVESYNLLNSSPEQDFDDITKMASFICDARVSLITLIDKERNWFKSAYGVPFSESPRELSFCGHAITSNNDYLIVEDARKDERFADNPLVTELKEAIFYFGIPLINDAGYKLGTLCVFDNKPKQLNDKQIESVQALARQVIHLFEYKKRNTYLEFLSNQLQEKNNLLKDFAGNVSHDMKMPLANIITTTDVIKKRYGNLIGLDGQTYMNYLKESAFSLSDYITGMLGYYTSSDIVSDDAESFMLNDILEEVIDMLNITDNCEIITPIKNLELTTNKSAIMQIFLNLLTNALKYNDKECISITIEAANIKDVGYEFKVTDNGVGIAEEDLKNIFNLFKIATQRDRNGRKGSGIGLSTVKKLTENLGGEISVSSILGECTTFDFTVSKANLSKAKSLKIA